MSKNKYHIKCACPQCGNNPAALMTDGEFREKYRDVPNINMSCGECAIKYNAAMPDTCPDGDNDHGIMSKK